MSQVKFTINSNIIGSRIKEARKRKKISQKKLAQDLGLARGAPAISDWESGRHIPRPNILKSIAENLEVTVDWLMGKEPEHAPAEAVPTLQYGAPPGDSKIDEAIKKASRILSSGTSYADALYVNIIHFDKALDAEERIRIMEDQQREQAGDLCAIKEELKAMRDHIKRVEQENAELKKGDSSGEHVGKVERPSRSPYSRKTE